MPPLHARGARRGARRRLRPAGPGEFAAARAFAGTARGFTGPSAGVYGAELRAGSPVRIVRGDDGASPSAANLFSAGEGASYSGGIMSSAVDGLRQAARVVARYAPPRA